MERCVFRAKDIGTPAECMGVGVCACMWVCDGVCLCEVRGLTDMGHCGIVCDYLCVFSGGRPVVSAVAMFQNTW